MQIINCFDVMIIQEHSQTIYSESEIRRRTMNVPPKKERFLSDQFHSNLPNSQKPVAQQRKVLDYHLGREKRNQNSSTSDFLVMKYGNENTKPLASFHRDSTNQGVQSSAAMDRDVSAAIHRSSYCNSAFQDYSSYRSFNQTETPDPASRKPSSRESTNILKTWLHEHNKNPYPTKGEKVMLAIVTKMTLTQVSTWFANARRRLKKENKMTWQPKNRSGKLVSQENERKTPERLNLHEPLKIDNGLNQTEVLGEEKALYKNEKIPEITSTLPSNSKQSLFRAVTSQDYECASALPYVKRNTNHGTTYFPQTDPTSFEGCLCPGVHDGNRSADKSNCLCRQSSAGMNNSLCSRTNHAQSRPTHCIWSSESQVYHPVPSDSVVQSHMYQDQLSRDNEIFTNDLYPPCQINHCQQTESNYFQSCNNVELPNPLPDYESFYQPSRASYFSNNTPTQNPSFLPLDCYSLSTSNMLSGEFKKVSYQQKTSVLQCEVGAETESISRLINNDTKVSLKQNLNPNHSPHSTSPTFNPRFLTNQGLDEYRQNTVCCYDSSSCAASTCSLLHEDSINPEKKASEPFKYVSTSRSLFEEPGIMTSIGRIVSNQEDEKVEQLSRSPVDLYL